MGQDKDGGSDRGKSSGGEAAKRRRGRGSDWSPALRDAFLALVRATGNGRAAAGVLGYPNMFHNRRRRDPEFRRAWDEAKAEAAATLAQADSAFVLPVPRLEHPLAGGSAEELGGFLRPGRKRAQTRPEPVIRRGRGKRPQISFAREGHVTAEIEADFLARLRVSGNFNASARAVGFQPASLRERVLLWPAFARACEDAVAEAEIALNYALVAHAHALLRTDGPACAEGESEPLPFDPATAMRILGFLDARRGGRMGNGRRKGPPARSFEEAVESVLAKIRAIEAHKHGSRQSGTLPRVEGGTDNEASSGDGGEGL